MFGTCVFFLTILRPSSSHLSQSFSLSTTQQCASPCASRSSAFVALCCGLVQRDERRGQRARRRRRWREELLELLLELGDAPLRPQSIAPRLRLRARKRRPHAPRREDQHYSRHRMAHFPRTPPASSSHFVRGARRQNHATTTTREDDARRRRATTRDDDARRRRATATRDARHSCDAPVRARALPRCAATPLRSCAAESRPASARRRWGT